MKFAEVPETVAQQIRAGLKNMGSKYAVYNKLRSRRFIGKDATKEAVVAGMSMEEYTKARNASPGETCKGKNPDLMTQAQYQA